ncbi:MAG: fucose isomerase [Pirellulales bacterium]|nr:fucose isomerase [Pirellulales bacterium]
MSKVRDGGSKGRGNVVYLVASGDLRLSANQTCWPAQHAMEEALRVAVEAQGYRVERAHPVKEAEGHGFIASQREGIEVFKNIPADAPLIVAEAVWQYSHHVLAGLTTHRGPILTAANWSGQWPGLVGMLNLNGSLTKAGVAYSTLWSEDFTDAYFTERLGHWLQTGQCEHDLSHVKSFDRIAVPAAAHQAGEALAGDLQRNKAIMGVFDEGCMGMFNAIVPDALLHRTGVFKERLSQSALYYETLETSTEEADEVRAWVEQRGMRFHTGPDEATDLTDQQIRRQCQMYIAAVRLADDLGCDVIGIQYQQGLKDLLPASDLVEGMLNSSERPPVFSRDGKRELLAGRAVPHFNEVDECAGLDALLIQRVHNHLKLPAETTLHDLRWGDVDRSGTTDEYVWVFEISGAAPAEHHQGGWAGSEGFRQPPMYFPLGGSTLRGVAKPGEIVWSRIYVENDALQMDIGRGQALSLPAEETQRRWNATTPQWPVMHGVTYGVSRDQMMARHKANHVQVAYGGDAATADEALLVRAAMAQSLGISVHLCGSRKNGAAWEVRAAGEMRKPAEV